MSRIGRSMVVAALAGSLLTVPGAATAEQEAPVAATASASASVGAVDIVVAGRPGHAAPIAPCTVGGTERNSARGTDVGRTTSFGAGDTRCARTSGGAATAKATGQRFRTSVLRQFGGPVLRVRTFSAECRTTGNGSEGYVELGGVSGFRLPSEIPADHTITIPGRSEGDPPMAEIVLNDLVAPTPPDGSLTTHALHIKLFPQGGPASGDIFVGTAGCDPYAG
ncbi:hypothetical protein B0I33_103303 [Prauserella shujinwangii]|uniref:Secreted protein n=1 Tax=Prauserella shujinwangii TaxID=1453103 RepID=A0A2T0LYT4_9PSEU|nr:hypothetical protein [Prauserella shujinwangii]PRX49269.1 hypothetical protein B0I33_103303 [Prauserella shujinwangii]